MTLVNTRAAFEKAVTDKVLDFDPTISMVYDNVHFTTPGKTQRYILMTLNAHFYHRKYLRMLFQWIKIKKK